MTSDELRQMKDKGPYEHITDYNITMYDKFPYIRDISICGPETLVLISGNILKYYSYKVVEPFNIIPKTQQSADTI
ncbi:hypothetical protein [Anaerocolumna sp. MB42-C2]|uniref:hypothetical protein n=1 Tax=Anaerocolumna sp. MB42-C2 TaxID=3070997 RepID=UPI0027DEC130|nr:hypothetical protein [Anaerocolumna sp. MB42-C2]WMJ87826.1 hypothetical protein RBU59_27990 [Anaerocolumna sp. MB42-C2]